MSRPYEFWGVFSWLFTTPNSGIHWCSITLPAEDRKSHAYSQMPHLPPDTAAARRPRPAQHHHGHEPERLGTGIAQSSCRVRAGGSTINFKPSLTGAITLTSGEITIDHGVTINGAGRITVSGNHQSRIFEVDAPTTITGLTLQNGTVSGGTNDGYGGAVENRSAVLHLSDDTFTGNTAPAGGGAIYSGGQLSATNCTFESNSTDIYGGAVYTVGPTTISHSEFVSNTVAPSFFGGGGAIYANVAASAKVTVDSSTFSSNTANGPGGSGGAVENANGTVELTGDTFTSNSAVTQGGAVYNASGSTLAVTNSVFGRNSATDPVYSYGGAIANLGSLATITNSTFGATLAANSASHGGAVYNSGTGPLTIDTSTLTGNLPYDLDNNGVATIDSSILGVVTNTGTLHLNQTTFIG